FPCSRVILPLASRTDRALHQALLLVLSPSTVTCTARKQTPASSAASSRVSCQATSRWRLRKSPFTSSWRRFGPSLSFPSSPPWSLAGTLSSPSVLRLHRFSLPSRSPCPACKVPRPWFLAESLAR